MCNTTLAVESCCSKHGAHSRVCKHETCCYDVHRRLSLGLIHKCAMRWRWVYVHARFMSSRFLKVTVVCSSSAATMGCGNRLIPSLCTAGTGREGPSPASPARI